MAVPLKLKTELAYDPKITLLSMHPEELEAGSQRNICTSMFIAALLTIGKTGKQVKCRLIDDL